MAWIALSFVNLCDLAEEGRHKELRAEIDGKKRRFDVRCEDGISLIELAVRKKHKRIVRYLVSKYIKAKRWNERFVGGTTLLHFAAFGGDMNQVRYLVEKKKLSVNRRTPYGTPLHWAAAAGNLSVVKYLGITLIG